MSHVLTSYRNGRSQVWLAKQLRVTKATVSRWESGRRKIAINLLPKVARITGIPKKDLRPDLALAIEE